MIKEVILTYYGTHTCFDEVRCYLDRVDTTVPIIVDMNGDRKPINSVLCFRDDGYWTVKFLEFSSKDIAPLIHTLNQKPFISVDQIVEPYSLVIPGETKIPYVYDGEEEMHLIQEGKINLSDCIKGELYLSGKIKDIYFDEDEEKRGIEVINYTEIIKDWRSFAKRGTGDSEHYGTEFRSFKTPKVEIVFSDKSVKFYNDLKEVKELLDSYEKKMTIDYKKRYKDRDPFEFLPKKLEDGSFLSGIPFFLDFYNKNKTGKKRHCSQGFDYCECDFENVINDSSDPDLMRSVLTIFNIVDETFFVALNHHYKEYRKIFPLPKFESHENRGQYGNTNLIPTRTHKDYEEEVHYKLFNRGIIEIFRNTLWQFGHSETNRGFITELTSDCEECNSLDMLIPDHLINAIEIQSKYCFSFPLLYSGLRNQIKNSKILY